jgi:hypothetical protein
MDRLNHNELPLVPHSGFAGSEDCCGCLIVVEREDVADLGVQRKSGHV